MKFKVIWNKISEQTFLFIIIIIDNEVFTDILQTKGTNGYLQIPRVSSPVKHKKDQSIEISPSTHLPRVANKYVLGSRRITEPDVIPQSVNTNIDQSVQNTTGKLSVDEATNDIEEPFRERASTFPGKVRRPVVTINNLLKDTNAKEHNDKSEVVVKTRVYRTKTDPLSNSKRDHDAITPTSPISRFGSPFQKEGVVSPTQKTGNNHLFQYRKHSGIQRRIVTAHKPKDADTSKDSMHEEDGSGSTGKHMLSRPSRTNRFSRVSTGSRTSREDTVILTDVSSTRPLSSRNATSNFRSATPALPSLHTDKRKT